MSEIGRKSGYPPRLGPEGKRKLTGSARNFRRAHDATIHPLQIEAMGTRHHGCARRRDGEAAGIPPDELREGDHKGV